MKLSEISPKELKTTQIKLKARKKKANNPIAFQNDDKTNFIDVFGGMGGYDTNNSGAGSVIQH